jgi:predicted ATP-grasp superfamily ATP-dependent carboligase
VIFDPDADHSVGDLLAIVEREGIDVILAAALSGNEFICRHRHALEPIVHAAYNDLGAFDQLANKQRAAMLADELRVPRPRAIELRVRGVVERVGAELGFPVVFKSAVGQGSARHVRDVAELRRVATSFWTENVDLVEQEVWPLVQEYIDGTGHGYYGLSKDGEVLAHFMHRRLHEVPPTGGPSAMAASFRDARLRELGERFFAATGWTGVAMVEFKRRSRDGEYYLIEVNPKFWGSLALSIAAGVDFPYLLYRLLAGDPQHVTLGDYRDDCVFRWLTMDLAYAVATRRLGAYLRTFANRRVGDDFVGRDPAPLAMLFLQGMQHHVRSTRPGSH